MSPGYHKYLNSELPRVYFTEIHESRFRVHLDNIPLQFLNFDRALLSVWTKQFNALEWQLYASIPKTLWKLESESQGELVADYIVNVHLNHYFSVNSSVRIVLQIVDDNSVSPSDHSSLMDEVVVEKHHGGPSYATKYYTNPNEGLFEANDRKLQIYLEQAMASAQEDVSKLSEVELSHVGMSGRKFRHLMNNIGAIPNNRYLEIGVFNGSTLISSLAGNRHLKAVAIDGWLDDFVPYMEKCNMQDVMNFVVKTVEQYVPAQGDVHILQSPCWDVSPGEVTKMFGGEPVLTYLFDAGHSVLDHYLALTHFVPAMADTFIFIVDDWGWSSVQGGTYTAINDLSLQILYQIEVSNVREYYNDLDPENNLWHNGLSVFLLKKT